MSFTKHLLQFLVSAAILAAGVFTFKYLKDTKPEAEKVERVAQGTLVEVVTARRTTFQPNIVAQGTVVPAKRINVSPQVAGRVRWINKNLVAGGRIRRGKRLVRIEGADFRNQLQSQQAMAEQARLNLELEQGRQRVAQREWELFGSEQPNPSAEGRARALREPQLRNAELSIRSAETSLSQARVNLGRTVLRAPFDVLVQVQNVERGQVVSPGMSLATLVGVDEFWVEVSVPVDALESIAVPGLHGAREGAEVKVIQRVAGTELERTGRVARLLPDLDPAGSMARIVVSIRDPLEVSGEGDLPMLLGSYVTVEIDGPSLGSVIEVPRTALREGDRVFVMNGEAQLEPRQVSKVWSQATSVLVDTGLEEGDRIIISRVPNPVTGMSLRLNDPAPAPDEGAQPEPTEATATP